MTTKFKDVAPFYLGCNVEFGPEDDKTTSKLTGINLFGVPSAMVMLKHVPFELIKPILRPLSSMTEDEFKEWFQLIYLPCPEDQFEAFLAAASKPKYSGLTAELPFVEAVSVINFLRSKYFDIDRLIESGEAIDATTV